MDTNDSAALVWLHDDLRLDDHPALHAVLAAGLAPRPVFVHAPDEAGEGASGSAAHQWLRRSLQALDGRLRERGSGLLLAAGPSLTALRRLGAELGVRRLHWNERNEPRLATRDAEIARSLRAEGWDVEIHPRPALVDWRTLRTGGGKPYQVFTPFYRAALAQLQRRAVALPEGRWPPPAQPVPAPDFDGVGLAPARPAWDEGFWADGFWQPGEAGARRRLNTFASASLAGYDAGRDRPAEDGTSRLAPHLKFGELSPRRLVQHLGLADAGASVGAQAWLRQLMWREFAQQVLWHWPDSATQDFRPVAGLTWHEPDLAWLRAWQRGRTGVPLVDAGMRQLWVTGWMHNRVRMVAASWLVKNMGIHWQHGARWFADTLVDADLANNALGWQWVAGTGTDAAPYHRVFNPVLQARRFDPEAAYATRWVPELAALPVAQRFEPWRWRADWPARLGRLRVVLGG